MGPSCSQTLTTCQPKCNLTCESRAFESAPVFLFGGLVYTFGLPSLVGLYFCGKFADFAVGTGTMHWLRSHLIVQAHTRLPLWRTGSHMGLNGFRRCSKLFKGKRNVCVIGRLDVNCSFWMDNREPRSRPWPPRVD